MAEIEVKTPEEAAEQAAPAEEKDAAAAEDVVEVEVELEPEAEAAEADEAEADEVPKADDAEKAEEAEDSAEEAAAEEGEASPNIFEAITAEVTELRDRYARLQAEWDNYRKRTQAERAQERVRASEKLVVDLLPVLDDLERAINHAKESGEGGSLTEGVEAIQTKFLQILGKHKVSQVEALDKPFDAMEHQAVGTAENTEVPEETVVTVYQQGYKIGDRVIRPAMVVTSTGGPERKAVEADDEE